MNKVYIVLVNYNQYQDTIECVESILKSDYKNFQIFIIDNSPNEKSLTALSGWFSGDDDFSLKTEFEHLVLPAELKPLEFTIANELDVVNNKLVYNTPIVLISTKNNGFAAANNIALKYILNQPGQALVWILNNDTVIEKNTLTALVDFYKNSPDHKQIFGAKLRYYHKPDYIQAVAGEYNVWIGRHKHIGEGELDNGQFDNFIFKKANYVVGASMFIDKAYLEQVGLMCEDYFLYFEEMDWKQIAQKKGFSMCLVPNAIVYHKEGASIGSNKKTRSNVADFYSITNRVKFIKKWYPYALITVMPGVILAITKRVYRREYDLVKKVIKRIWQLL